MVNISLKTEEVDIILKKCGFVSETVLGWYSPSYIPFEQAVKEYEDGQPDVLYSAQVTVAYEEGHRPQILDYKYVDITALTPYKIGKVLNKIINDTLKKIVLDSI